MLPKKMSAIKLPCLIGFVLSISILSGCSLVRSGIAYFQFPDDFIQLGTSGVFYENGAKQYAERVEKLLPATIVTIEEKQFKPFNN